MGVDHEYEFVDLSVLELVRSECECDPNAFIAAIVKALRDDNAVGARRRIADMIDPGGDTIYRLTLSVRPGKGTPQARKQGLETFLRLLEIYQSTKNPRNFVSRAMKQTGLSRKTIEEYKPKILHWVDSVADAESQKALQRELRNAPDDETAIARAVRAGFPESEAWEYLAWLKDTSPC